MLTSCLRFRLLGGSLKQISRTKGGALWFRQSQKYSSTCSNYYEKIKNQYFFGQEYKSSNLKFENQGINLIGYQFNPQLSMHTNFKPFPTKLVVSGNIIVLNFLLEVDDEMNDDVWKNRKGLAIDMKTAFKMFKLSPESPNFTTEIVHADLEGTYTTDIQIDYKAKDNMVELTASKTMKQNQASSHIWDLNFTFTYGEYLALMEWIRSGLIYTTGAALMIQHSLEKELLKAVNVEKDQIKKNKIEKKKK